MPKTLPLDRLTASDLFLLMWDDYGWSSDIGAVGILDGAGLVDRDGGVRIDAVRRHLEPKLQLVPRFRQLLYRPRPGLGWPLRLDSGLNIGVVAGLLHENRVKTTWATNPVSNRRLRCGPS
jgi:diacylglycerol O-acyltransferase / wax synthase